MNKKSIILFILFCTSCNQPAEPDKSGNIKNQYNNEVLKPSTLSIPKSTPSVIPDIPVTINGKTEVQQVNAGLPVAPVPQPSVATTNLSFQQNESNLKNDYTNPQAVLSSEIPESIAFEPVKIFKRGDKIAYTSDNSIFLIDKDGLNNKKLLNISKNHKMPSFSDDASKIFFVNTLIDNSNDLYKVNQDGSSLERVTNLSQFLSEPKISSDGDLIFIMNNQLYLYDSTGLYQMSQSSVPIKNPVWINNNEIAFIRTDNGTTGNIYSIYKNGKTFTSLTQGEEISSFDIKQGNLVFSDNKGIWVSNISAIINTKQILADLLVSEVVFSPDIKNIAFTSSKTGKRQIYTVQTDGNNLKQLTSGQTESYNPTW